MADPKWDDTEDINDAPSWDDTEEVQSVDSSKMGALEAGITGLGEGASFGLAPIASGIVGVGMEAAKDVGDILGLTDDAKLRKQGFDIPEDKKGLQGLMEAYYESRDAQRKQQNQAMEDQPVASIAGNIVGGVAGGGALGPLVAGASKGGKVAQLASKLAPSVESMEGATKMAKVGKAALEGAKAGGLTAFGSGESKITDPNEVAKEVMEGAALGSLVSGGLSGGYNMAKSAGGSLANSGIGKAVSTGIKAAKEGIDVANESQVVQKIKSNIEDIKGMISKHFGKKKDYYKYADEIGIRINAGESIDEIMDDFATQGLIPESEKGKLQTFMDDIRSLQKDVNIKAEKAKEQTELAAAKKIDTLQRTKGAELETSTDIDKNLDDLRILPETDGNVIGTQDKVRIPVEDGEFIDKKVITSKAIGQEKIPGKRIDFNEMSFRDSDSLKYILGDIAYGDGNPSSVKALAGKLYGAVRDIQNEALNSPDMSIGDNNSKLSKLFQALETIGIDKDDFFSRSESDQLRTISSMINQLSEKGSLGDLIKKEGFMDFIEAVEPGAKQSIRENLEYVKNLGGFVKDSSDDSVNFLRATIGTIPKFAGGVSNKATMVTQSLKDTAKNSMKEIFNQVSKYTPEQTKELATRLVNSGIKGASEFTEPLLKSASMDDRTRQSVLYMLAKQPAFRESIRRMEEQENGAE